MPRSEICEATGRNYAEVTRAVAQRVHDDLTPSRQARNDQPHTGDKRQNYNGNQHQALRATRIITVRLFSFVSRHWMGATRCAVRKNCRINELLTYNGLGCYVLRKVW